MIFGILPFLVQWLALSSDESRLGTTPGSNYNSNSNSNSNYNYNYNSYPSYPPKSYYSLISDLQQLPEEEIESFLPQICNILFDCDREDFPYDGGGGGGGGRTSSLFNYFESVVLSKCADCLPFGMKVCGLLKVLV